MIREINFKFVEFIPDTLEEGTLYISTEYCTAIHKCACGCGNEVITPISPTDWELIFNGKTVSLYPSIGNWSFPCKSHYFVTKNKIRFAKRLDDWEIEEGRKKDTENKAKYFKRKNK